MTNPNQGGYQPYPGGDGYGGDGYGDAEPTAPGAPNYGEPAYPSYPNQPADYSQFEVNSAAGAAGATALRYHGQQLTDGYYGDGQMPHPINDPHANGWAHRKGTGKLRLGEAISWSFKAFGKNPKFWLVIGLISAVLSVMSSVATVPGMSFLSAIASVLLWPVFVAAALQQTLVVKLKSPSTPAYGKSLGVAVLLVFAGSILATILGIITFMFAFASIDLDPAALPQQPDDIFGDPELMGTIMSTFGLVTLVILLLVMLLVPFVVYPMYYAADNNGGFGHAIGAGVKAGARSYLPTLGLILFSGLIAILASLPAVLTATGTIGTVVGGLLSLVLTMVAAPISLLLGAHAYRQVSGGPVPYEAAA
ncbi:hypothetical protein JKI95_07045 [Corynebacterium aquatimens]|uniref:hypothetical protein n=1 Tax=Corynebacterium TaxID=1716 RepID=UPI001F46A0ED|nr:MULTISPECIES: hypothetical protein [Corynebacterium]QYH19043.1 hypothetical protein JKI95_07045 [Corynebacterium aquatimens]UIZ92107.1 hypothetical protein JZY91_10695 [Corynebacterium sp. CNCTC7651]